MASVGRSIVEYFGKTKTKFSEAALLEISDILEKNSGKKTDLHLDSKVFKKVWTYFNSDSNDNLVVAIGLIISYVIYEGGVLIEFDPSKDVENLRSFLLRLIQSLQKKNISVDFKSYNIKAISSLILNISDYTTRIALGPLFSIASWKKPNLLESVDNDIVTEYQLEERYNTAIELQNKLEKKARIIDQILSSWVVDSIDLFISETNPKILTGLLNQFSIILSQLPTRKFPKSLFDNKSLLAVAQSKNINETEYLDSLRIFEYFLLFPLDEFSSELVTEAELKKRYNERVSKFQIIASSGFDGELDKLSFGESSIFSDSQKLRKELEKLDSTTIDKLLKQLNLFYTEDSKITVIVNYLSNKTTLSSLIDEFDTSSVATLQSLSHSSSYTIFGNNQQYLSIEDLLIRNFWNLRHQNFRDIKTHVISTVSKFTKKGDGKIQGRSKYGLKINGLDLIEGNHHLTKRSDYSNLPEVLVKIDLNSPAVDVQLWNKLGSSDVIIFNKLSQPNKDASTELAKVGIEELKAATIIEVLDNNGLVKTNSHSKNFTIKARFHQELEEGELESYNLMVILPEIFVNGLNKSDLSKYKVKLDSIAQSLRSLNTSNLPEWLSDLVMGIGGKDTGSWTEFERQYSVFLDSFGVSLSLLKETLPEYDIKSDRPQNKKRKTSSIESMEDVLVKTIAYEGDKQFSVVLDQTKPTVTVNKMQARALIQSQYEGLVLVNGPSGTGKKTVASLVANSYVSSYPKDKTLVIAKNSETLKELFQKFETSEVFLNLSDPEYIQKTIALLDHKISGLFAKITTFAEVLGADLVVDDDASVAFLRTNFIESIWKDYLNGISNSSIDNDIAKSYPFKDLLSFGQYFEKSIGSNPLSVITEHYLQICQIIWEAENILVILKMKTLEEKIKFLLLSFTKVIGVTQDDYQNYADYYGEYENVIILESSLLNDFETLSPILPKKSIKRVTLLGDLYSQSPIDTNISLFEKLIQKKLTKVNLTQVYGTRGDILKLINSDITAEAEERFESQNDGFTETVQLIPVASSPGPQLNLEEGEFVFQLFRYMLSRGYKPEKIAIITPYYRQKILIDEISSSKDEKVVPFVSTIQGFTGQKRDIIVASLVNSDLPDLKQLNSLISNAKLGLYIVTSPANVKSFQEMSKGFGNDNKFQIVEIEKESKKKKLIEVKDHTALSNYIDELNYV